MTSGKKNRQQERESRMALNVLFTGVVFCFFVITMVIVTASITILVQQDILTIGSAKPDATHFLLYIAITSILLGSVLSYIVSRVPLRPVNQVINAMNRLASGDFKTRLQFGKMLSRHPTMQELKGSFNKMAEELENTEVLRTDFVNNFSHEFKPPHCVYCRFRLPPEARKPDGGTKAGVHGCD